MGKERDEKTKDLGCQRGKRRASAKVLLSTYGKKVAKALTSCDAYLEKSIAASKSASEESENWMWHAAAEARALSDEDIPLNWKTGSNDGSDSATRLLGTVKGLVIRSKELTATGIWPQARRCAYDAANILPGIQREQTKKKRSSISE